MWEKGEEDAVAISAYLGEKGLKNCRILDVPCGIGRVAIPLARLGFVVTGLDLSPHLVSSAEKRAGAYKIAPGRAKFLRRRHATSSVRRFEPGSLRRRVERLHEQSATGSEEDDLKFFREARAPSAKRGGMLLISGLRNRDYIARNPSQNIYEESKRLLVLDNYRFDLTRSREKGTWRFYLKHGRKGEVLKFSGEFPTDIRVYSPHELSSRLAATGWERPGRPTSSFTVTRGACRGPRVLSFTARRQRRHEPTKSELLASASSS